MATKTCMQINVMTGRKVRRAHVLPDGSDSGYARCAECGVEFYVGHGSERAAFDRAEGDFAASMRGQGIWR